MSFKLSSGKKQEKKSRIRSQKLMRISLAVTRIIMKRMTVTPLKKNLTFPVGPKKSLPVRVQRIVKQRMRRHK